MIVVLLSCIPFATLLAAATLRVVAAAQPETSWSGERRLLLIRLSYIFLVMSLVGMLFLTFAVGALGAIGFMLVIILTASLVEAEVRIAGVRNRARQAELLWVLATAVKSGRPLPDEIEAYACGTWGRRHRLLMGMAERLRDGDSLTEIVVPQGLLPNAAAMQIHSGISSQSLADALKDTARRATQELADDQESGSSGTSLIYPAALIPTAFLIVSFLMYWIIPKFKKIFDDFGTELPGVTISLIKLSDCIVNYWFLFGLPLIYLPVCVFVLVTMGEYRGWRAMSQSIFGRWFARWYTPDVLRALSQGIEQGLPIEKALSPIIKFSGPVNLRNRLDSAVEEIKAGHPSWQSLKIAGILTSREAAVLVSAEQTGNLPWALGTLATAIERQWMFRIRAIIELAQPIALIAVSMMVAFIAMAMFMPLIKLLNDLS